MAETDDTRGLSQRELLLDVRQDVKGLLVGQATQNNTLGNHEKRITTLDRRLWGVIIGSITIAATVIVALATSGH